MSNWKLKCFLQGRQTKLCSVHKKLKSVYKILESLEVEGLPSDLLDWEILGWQRDIDDIKDDLGTFDSLLTEHLLEVRDLEKRYFK